MGYGRGLAFKVAEPSDFRTKNQLCDSVLADVILPAMFPEPAYILRTAFRTEVRFLGKPIPHSTSGYRLWRGHALAAEPLVALVLIENADGLHWTRTSHRGSETPEMQIMYAPVDQDGLKIQVAFSIQDATACGSAVVPSIQTHPMPRLERTFTGEVHSFGAVAPTCELKAMFLARRDVTSVRNGIWHARANLIRDMADPWRAVFTYGRTGTIQAPHA